MTDSDSLGRRAFLAAAGTAAAGALAGCSSPDGGSGASGGAVTRADATTVVTSLGGIREALGSASAGDVVFVPPSTTIDVSGTWNVEIPSGVTLAGGRGAPGEGGGAERGALLHSSPGDESPDDETHHKFDLRDGSRFTGFRLRGHHHEYVNPVVQYDGNFYAHRGGGVRVHGEAEVDRSEIFDWVHAAVAVAGSAHVHHNHLHHNTWEGLGYGVAVAPRGMPIIEHNYFNYNRHSITGTGDPETAYVARYNVIGPDWVGPQFDMHGTEGDRGVAGRKMVVRNNTFKATRVVDVRTGTHGVEPAIRVRGTPTEGITVENNWFYHWRRSNAYNQTGGPHKVSFADNHFGKYAPPSRRVGAPRSSDGAL